MIKNYTELSSAEKERLLEFVQANSPGIQVKSEIQERFESEEFLFGKGVIIKYSSEDIFWKASVILKEAGYKNIGYVVDVVIDLSLDDWQSCLDDLKTHAQSMAKIYGLKEMKLGTRNEKLMAALASRGCSIAYRAIRMVLEKACKTGSTLTLVPLNNDSIPEFLEVYNDAFSDIPNGATLFENEALDYAKENSEDPRYFLVTKGEETIGFAQFEVNEAVGEFDIGLRKAYHGLGLGSALLETAILHLNEKQVKVIELTVITGNEPAMNLYLQKGFVETKTLGNWYDMSDI